MNNKQEAFIREYLQDFNKTKAAIRAGYSEKTARAQGSRLFTNADIAGEIKARIAEKTMSSEEVLNRLADIARGDMSDLMSLSTMGFNFNLLIEDENGNRIPNPKTKLIKRIKQKVTTITEKSGDEREIIDTDLELYSAQEALNTIAKLNGMIVEKMDVTSKGEKVTPNETYDRGISELAAALREIIPGQDTEPDGNVDTPK
jgi:phage terminase small subunit